jgi:MFS family permease
VPDELPDEMDRQDRAQRIATGDRRESRSLFRPLRLHTFRNLLVADVVSDVGTFMQSVGAAWLMLSLGAGPMYVALTQTASALPFFLLALPAGAVGDIVDRRKLILSTETWMVAVATVLAAATLAGAMTPWLLLTLTFGLAAGDAFETPTWRAVLPELVPKADLPAASALNGIEFNIARATGPALAGALIAVAGVGAAFIVNALSFAGVILVVARWKRPPRKLMAPAEHIAGATVEALRYVRYSPDVLALILRSGIVMLFASGLLALLPLLARRSTGSALGYGILLGCFGAGAIAGGLAMQPARARWSNETVVSAGIVILGSMIVAAGVASGLGELATLVAAAGAAWIVFISLFSALAQALAPDWVRARVLAVFMLVFQGGIAAGSALWGFVGQRYGLEAALLWAGVGTIVTAVLGFAWRLPAGTVDVSAWNHWRMPVVVKELEGALEEGPILVTVEYHVSRDNVEAFLKAIRQYGSVRRRDGASRWEIYQDMASSDLYIETFLVRSWAEHLRQHARQTQADREVEERVHSYVHGEPKVTHLIGARRRRRSQA